MPDETIIVEGPPPKGGGLFHGSCVAVNGRAVLILGPSGAGKSALALELMGYGAQLVADDQTRLTVENGRLVAEVPASIRGRIEARFVGILAVQDAGPTPVALVVDMGRDEKMRLPQKRAMILLGESVPLLHNSATRHFGAAILQYLKGAYSD